MDGVWWSPRSSKPLRPDRVGLGGFDSHTLPPARRAARSPRIGPAVSGAGAPVASFGASLVASFAASFAGSLAGSLAVSLAVAIVVSLTAMPFSPLVAPLVAPRAASLSAQTQAGTRAGAQRPPAERSTAAQARDTVSIERVAPEDEPRAPITPGRAFRLSLVFPGAGQARLDRPYAGGVFLFVEALALAMLHRSAEDLQLARSFRGDSMPRTYQLDATTGLAVRDTLGNPLVTAWDVPRYTDTFVRTRRLHLEDWMAVLIFNHLFAGADAYVAAQLWDLPSKVALRQMPFGPALAYTLQFGRPPRR